MSSTGGGAMPLPSTQPLAVDFLQNRRNTGLKFDPQKQHFVAELREPAPWEATPDALALHKENGLELVEMTSSFTSAIQELQKKKANEPAIARFSFKDARDWGDVDSILRSAKKNYLDKDSLSGKIRKMFRSIGKNGKSIQSFIGLLPDGNYKTLCGGLTLILSAMMRHEEIREKMDEVMEELPIVVESCEEYLNIYPDIDELQGHVEELYIDLLSTLEDFVKWYMQGQLRHIVDSVMKNANYGQSIEVRIRNIQRSRQRFEDALRRFGHWRLKMMHNEIHESKEIVQNSHATLQRMECGVDNARKGIEEVGQVVIRRVNSLAPQIVNGIQNVLIDETKNAEWQKKWNEHAEEKKRLLKDSREKDRQINELKKRVNETSYLPSFLSDALSLDLEVDSRLDDLDSIETTGLTANTSFQMRSKRLADTTEFRHWLSSDDSGILHIQGDGDQESITPVSFLSSLLHRKLLDGGILVLPFFCGLHTGGRFKDSHEMNGPLMMIRALLAQILRLKGVDWMHDAYGLPYLSFGAKKISRLTKGSFSAYLGVVTGLLSKLRKQHSPIFLIIDGLDWYDLTWGREVKRLIESLLRFMDSPSSDGVFKVLLGTATHLDWHPKTDSDFVILEMPGEIYEEGESFEELE
ncbi:MAG: hypothetical protein M1820_008918 [Bogoriella megaspora]|nr:MAG: hypothetical protein M1820_008918 [Bogoriella megaspora]